jgi:hypothetical protein
MIGTQWLQQELKPAKHVSRHQRLDGPLHGVGKQNACRMEWTSVWGRLRQATGGVSRHSQPPATCPDIKASPSLLTTVASSWTRRCWAPHSTATGRAFRR